MERTISENVDLTQRGGYFPFRYVVDFLEFLHKNRDLVKIITYRDMAWGGDFDYINSYPEEYKTWSYQLKKGLRDKGKIFVLLQHDVDMVPERTINLLREEERLELSSNIMIFNRRINRRHLQKTGELLYTEYDIDHDYLRHLRDEHDFVIGYHSNAFGRALFDMEKAEGIFEEDVGSLRKKFDIQYFSPHGGAKSPDGLSNNCVPVPEALKNSIRWVNNKFTPYFDGNYSDGGINSPLRDPEKRDLRDFVKKWKRGMRYRILLHPQYYHSPWTPSPRLAGTEWYDRLLEFCSSENGGSTWDGVSIG